MSANADRECVKVIVRCRPFNQREKDGGYESVVQVDEDHASVVIQSTDKKGEGPKQFTFDYAFPMDCKQIDVYNKTARTIVDAVLEGYNGTIFAYGQTGSGKTFSMQGVRDVPELRGILPNAFEHVFAHINSSGNGTQYLVRASYLEIYNEEVRDLLVQTNGKLDLKENPDTGVYVKDLSTFIVKDVSEIEKLMAIGNKNRVVGATLMNAESSRSHSLFTVTVEMSEPSENGEHIRVGKLNLVDLAGSERQSKTGATGDRLKEAAKINLSLTALGNVISALVDGKSSHVPYRDSKLTRLLQDSLGGNSKTMMIATFSPASFNYEETLSTLRYASRTKQIKNKPKVNEDPKDTMLREFQAEIERLKNQLASLEGGDPSMVQTLQLDTTQIVVNDANRNLGSISEETNAMMTVQVHGLSAEKIKEMQETIDREKRTIEESRQIAEAEKAVLLEKLNQRAAELEKEKQERETLTRKLELMQQKLLIGGVNILDQAEKDALELQRQTAALEEQNRRERELQRELEIQKEQKFQIEESYSSLQEEATSKTKKLKKLWTMLMDQRQELKEVQRENQREREELIDQIQRMSQEIKLKSMIVQSFIPNNYLQWIEENSVYDMDTERYKIPLMQHAGNIVLRKQLAAQRNPLNKEQKEPTWSKSKTILFPDVLLSYEHFVSGGLKSNQKSSSRAKSRQRVSRTNSAVAKTETPVVPQVRGLLEKTKHYA